MRGLHFASVFVLVVAATSVPSGARAWANAQVASARAVVHIDASGETQVRMDLTVQVHAGWLTELEVAGLDHALTLDETSPATFTRSTGEAVPFEIVADTAGRVAFRFDRRVAPRIGDYAASFVYRTSIAESGITAGEDGRVRYVWTFPAWAAGLDAVRLELHVPSGAEVARVARADGREGAGDDDDDDENASGATLEVIPEPDGVQLAFHRVHLPRSIAWPVAFTLPAGSVPLAQRPAVVRPAGRAASAPVLTSRDGRPQPTTRFVVLACVVVALFKRFSFSRTARARGARPEPLVPLASDWVVGAIVVMLGLVAAHFWPRWPEAAFVALACMGLFVAQRPAARVGTSRLGSFHAATANDLRAARWDALIDGLSPAAWFDATRPAGFVVMLATLAGLASMHAREPADSVDAMFSVPHALVLLGLFFFVGGSSMIPLSASGRLLELASIARGLRLPEAHGREFALRLVMHRDVRDVAQDARLRLTSENRAPGLVRLDVALVERATLGGYVANAVVLVVVRQGSEAERILARAAPVQSVRAAPGGRRARILPLRASTFAAIDRLAAAPEVQHVPRAVRLRASVADASAAPL